MAEQLEFFPVPSPCRGLCQADNRGYCVGCLRSREERFGWMSFTDTQKRTVIRLCQPRRLRWHKAPSVPAEEDPEQPSLFSPLRTRF